ncbi:MAG: LysM peptidoglycan-binding domain-containing protein [Defluviitaleaceae bacterium]|nr:LysM peptidoglycan-binding domain-containing protein [Defluviitaleaceae bacterium]
MDIYLTCLETNDRIRFPQLPEEISVRSPGKFQNYTIMEFGELQLPNGEFLKTFFWQSRFPGEARQYDPYIREWIKPAEILRLLEDYRQKGTKLRLLATETSVNYDVYIREIQGKYVGGYGDYDYTISFLNAKSLMVKQSAPPAPVPPPPPTASPSTPPPQPAPPLQNTPPQPRPEPPPAQTHTVVSGDTLWGIAQRYLGAGRRYPEIHAANRDVIGANPNRIFPGQVLTIPA